MFFEVGVWGEAPHIALLLFAEKQKGRFLEMPYKKGEITMTMTKYMAISKREALLKATVEQTMKGRIHQMPELAQAVCLRWYIGANWMAPALKLLPLHGSDHEILHRAECLADFMDRPGNGRDAIYLLPATLRLINHNIYCSHDRAASLVEPMPDIVFAAMYRFLPNPEDFRLYAAVLSMLLPECMDEKAVPYYYAYHKLSGHLITPEYDLKKVNAVITLVLSFLVEIAPVLYRDNRYPQTLLAMILTTVSLHLDECCDMECYDCTMDDEEVTDEEEVVEFTDEEIGDLLLELGQETA